MKVLLINGSPREKGCTFTALSEIVKVLDREGIEGEIHWIGNQSVYGCVACGHCKKGEGCIRQDVNLLARKMSECDALIIGSPVFYAGPNGALCALLDRLFYSHSAEFAGKPGACVVSCRRGGASAAFDRLNKYFTICNMPVVTSQYWNQVHGSKPEEVLMDEEGLQTMRTLALNLAWMLKGKENAPALPTYEKKIRTNFIQ